MPTTFKTAVAKYLRSGNPAQGTRAEYQTMLTKWKEWAPVVGDLSSTRYNSGRMEPCVERQRQ